MENIQFQDIINWFGDRGIIIDNKSFKRWDIDDKYIYWIPNDKHLESLGSDYLMSEVFKPGYKYEIFWCLRNSIYCEIYNWHVFKTLPRKNRRLSLIVKES